MSVGSPLGFHLVLRSEDDRVLAPGGRERRALVSVVLAAGKARGLLAFGAADTHLHVLTTADRAAAGQLAHALAIGLHAALAVPAPFAPVRIRPVEHHRHLLNAFRYVMSNAAHHGVVDPAATDASSLHDLLHLRSVAPWLADRVRRALPRVDRADLLEVLGLPQLGLVPSGGFEPGWLDAAAAVRLLPGLDGRAPRAAAARAALVAVALPLCNVRTLAPVLAIDPRSVRRLAQAADPLDVVALQRQLAWREALAGRGAAATRVRPADQGRPREPHQPDPGPPRGPGSPT